MDSEAEVLRHRGKQNLRCEEVRAASTSHVALFHIVVCTEICFGRSSRFGLARLDRRYSSAGTCKSWCHVLQAESLMLEARQPHRPLYLDRTRTTVRGGCGLVRGGFQHAHRFETLDGSFKGSITKIIILRAIPMYRCKTQVTICLFCLFVF